MNDCIFSAHCVEPICDRACSRYVQTSYLLERNGIKTSSPVFKRNSKNFEMSIDTLDEAKGKIRVVEAQQTAAKAELLTYCAICQNWQNSRLHCNVYNLKFSKFLEETKRSWSTRGDSDDLEYMRIWSKSASVLIISNIDYINFGDFESQTLLNLLADRQDPELTTIVVSPKTSMLVGKGMFFSRLQQILAEAVAKK